MRKYLVGFIAGLLFMAALPVYGAVTSMIGKKVSNEITVTLNNGDVGKAIVVDGRSYLPVRDLSNALKLKLNVTKEEISLVSQLIITPDNTDQVSVINEKINSLTLQKNIAVKKRDQINDGFPGLEKQFEGAKQMLDSTTDTTTFRYNQILESVEQLKKMIADTEQELVDLEAQIIDYDRQIEELESQLEELNK
jgi:hypothetical protein